MEPSLWTFALTAFAGAGIAIPLAIFLAREFFKVQLDKILAEHSHQLKLQSDLLSHKLAIEFLEKSTTFARVEADRTQSLKVLYSKINHIHFLLPNSSALIPLPGHFGQSYFGALTIFFQKSHAVHKEIGESWKLLGELAVLTDENTENLLSASLTIMQVEYDAALKAVQKILNQAQTIGVDNLTPQNAPADLLTFRSSFLPAFAREGTNMLQLIKTTLRADLGLNWKNAKISNH